MATREIGPLRSCAIALAAALTVTQAACALPGGTLSDVDFRAKMRTFVIGIAEYARTTDPDFIVIPQNGQELLTMDGEPDGPLAGDYVAAINGQGREDLFYGYAADNDPTPAADRDWMTGFLDRALAASVVPLVTDYAWTPAKVDDAYAQSAARGYVSFVADSRELDTIPAWPATVPNASAADITSIRDAGNFLYVINPDRYSSAGAFVSAIAATAYDLAIVDAYVDGTMLTAPQVAALATKPGGGRRLVIAYLSIGEAEDYRPYWQSDWRPGSPSFIEAENRDWPGNYLVRYWDPAWKAIIFGSASSCLDRIIAAGFDGVYLDIIDAFERFE